MYRTGVWSRLLAGALAAWFGVVMAAPAVLHSCPRAMASASVDVEVDGHAGHGGHHAGHQEGSSSTECQCLGSCAVSPPAVLPSAETGLVAGLEPVGPHEVSPTRDAVLLIQPDHLQPFATAPPPHLG